MFKNAHFYKEQIVHILEYNAIPPIRTLILFCWLRICERRDSEW